MNKQNIALEFLKCFCSGNINALRTLLSEDFQFKGPFLQSNSRDEYITVLEKDKPEKCDFSVLKVFEDDEGVCIFYEYIKQESTVTIAQMNASVCRAVTASVIGIALHFGSSIENSVLN